MTATDGHVDDAEPPAATRPRVVMLVANDLSIDTRVRKVAHEVAQAGLAVVVLGISRDHHEHHLRIGDAEVRLLPVRDTLRSRTHRTPLLPTSRSALLSVRMAASRDLYFLHQRDVGAAIGDIRRRAADTNRRHRARMRLPWKVTRLGRLVRLQQARALEALLRRGLQARFRFHERRQAFLLRRLRRVHRIETLRGTWRDVYPELHDYEAAFGPALDAYEPDIIHAHDVHLLGVAVRAAGRRQVAGRQTKVIYDAHEFVPGLAKPSPRLVKGWATLEAEHIRRCDAVIAVSRPMANAIAAEYQLARSPYVVHNAPPPPDRSERSVRGDLGLSASVPLIVYSGGITPERRVLDVVVAVGRLDGVHIALVTEEDRNTVAIQEAAVKGGFSDRVHILPYVPPHHVVSYLRDADIGVCPFDPGFRNYDLTLPNKLFEYLHAGLPVVASNCAATSELVTSLGVGAIFRSGDLDSLTGALSHLLDELPDYRSRVAAEREGLEPYSWEAQRLVLLSAYAELIDSPLPSSPSSTPHLPPLLPMDPVHPAAHP